MNHNVKLILTTLIIWLVASSSWAQSNTVLLLKSGARTVPNNWAAWAENTDFSAAERNDGIAYRIIHFQQMPNEQQHAQLAQAGVRLLAYLPQRAYIAALPTATRWSSLSYLPISGVHQFRPEDKMDEYLRYESYPNWSVSGEKIYLYLKLHERIPRPRLMESLSANGARIVQLYHRDQLALVQVAKSPQAIKTLAELSFVNYLETVEPPSEREDIDGNSLNRSNMLKKNGLAFDGSGISIQTRDDGAVGPHIDFQGRLENVLTSGTGTHGDGVAGIFGGAGNLNPDNDGGASGAFMYATDYVANFQDTTYGLHLYQGVKVTNSSYSNGCNAGYTSITQTVDNQIYASPTLMHVFSAGNSNNNDCGYGAGTQWGNITGGHKIGKNVIATANLFGTGVLANSSSRGPASDGRLKPDLAAHGQGQISTDPNNGYQSFGGTSAASPSAAGVITQLYQAYKELNNGQEPETALLKAVAMNTANDLGNPGPDFIYGFGIINAYKSYQLLKDQRYTTGSVAQGATQQFTVNIPTGVREARIMVYWMDPAGSLAASKALVNDLDMVVHSPQGNTTYPLVLDPTPNVAALNATATQGIDTLNNVEQVRLTNPAAGSYTVDVTGTIVPFGSHPFYVVYEFLTDDITVAYPNGGEGIDHTDVMRIHWDAQGNSGNFVIDYSTDGGTTWVNAGTAAGAARWLNWNVPAGISDNALIRVSRNGVSDVSDSTFTVIASPQNVSIDTVCANGVTVTWSSVTGATAYNVYLLGDKYMELVDSTTSNTATVSVNPYEPFWVAVAAKYNDGVGRRTNAINHNGGLLNCTISDDVGITLVAPFGEFGGCQADTTVIVTLTNLGQNDKPALQINYQLDNGAVVSQALSDTLFAGQTLTDTFAVGLNMAAGNTYELRTWLTDTLDLIPFNDTATGTIVLYPLETLLYTANFETFNRCPTTTNCGGTICPLTDGWINASDDNIDWRTHSGPTVSVGTGPSVDFMPGRASGQYLYLEGSNGCNNQTASLISPCFDLSGTTSPYASIGYHMWGNNIGTLSVDVYSNGAWVNGVASVSGNQGNAWKTLAVNLSAYAGQVITLRINGSTGNGFESDMAIDGIELFDFNSAPTVAFDNDISSTCPGVPVTFTDNSAYFVTQRQWTFTPNTVTFINGTSDTSANPVVVFNAQADYDVKLVATNAVGADSITLVDHIIVNGGAALPFGETFESFNNCGTDTDCATTLCALDNDWVNEANGIDDDIDWRTHNGSTASANTGPSFDHTTQTFVGKYLYLEASGNCNLATATLTSPCIDLTNTVNPIFSLWYHMYGGNMGSLFIDIYSNGAWVNNVGPALSGDQGDAWQEMTVSLSAYIGQSIRIRVRGRTGNGFESDLAIDDLLVYDINTPPVAGFNVQGAACDNNTTFVDNSTNGASSWQWDFGPQATPSTATGAGPHNVSFSNLGTQTVTLIVTSPAGSDTSTQTINVQDTLPVADFSWNSNNNVATFNNQSSGATSYFWNFGNGATSVGITPGVQIYNASGIYTVTLIASNDCGSDTLTRDIQIILTNTEEVAQAWGMEVFPNPSTGQFTLSLEGAKGDVTINITDVQGRLVHQYHTELHTATWIHQFDLQDIAAGLYFLKVSTPDGTQHRKLLIE